MVVQMPRARVLLVRAVSSSVRTPFGQRLMSCNMGGTGPECSDTPLQDDPKGRKTSTKSPPAALWSLMPKANLNRTALVCTKSGQEVSHRELQDMSLSFAGRLTRDLGYAVGDKLALVLGSNCIENVIVQLGAAAAGITVVTADKPEDRMLEGCRGLVVSANVLKERAPQGILEGEKHPPIVAHDDYGVGSASVALFWQGVIDCRPLPVSSAVSDHTLPFAVYGAAKATDRKVTQGDLATVAQDVIDEVGLTDADSAAVPVPLAHSFGFGAAALPSLIAGGSVLLLPEDGSAQTLEAALEEHNATLLFLDRPLRKTLEEQGVTALGGALRVGVIKIGSGWAFHEEAHKFNKFGSVPLVTLGRALPKRTSW